MERKEKFSLRKSSKYKNLASVSLGVFFVVLGVGANESSAQASEVKNVQTSSPTVSQPVNQSAAPVVAPTPEVQTSVPVAQEATVSNSVVVKSENIVEYKGTTFDVQLNQEKTEYKVNGIKSTNDTTSLEIPAEVEGKPITTIGRNMATEIEKQTDIKNIKLPESVKTLEAGALQYTNIENLTIPSSVESIKGALLESAHENKEESLLGYTTSHSKLKEVTLHSNLKSVTRPFDKNKLLTKVNFQGEWQEIPASLFYGSGIEKITLPDTIVKIGVRSFQNTELKEIDLPKNLREIGEYAFYNTKLENIILPETLRRIDKLAFANTNLTNIKLSDEIEEIGTDAFMGARIQNLVLPKNLRKMYYGSLAIDTLEELSVYPELQELALALEKNGEETGKQGPVGRKVNLKKLNLVGDWKEIPEGFFRNMEIQDLLLPETLHILHKESFAGTKIKKLILSSGIRKIDSTAFDGSEIEEIVIPKSIMYQANTERDDWKTDFYYILKNIKNLNKVTIEDGIKEIPAYMFSNSAITQLQIPDSVEVIGEKTFYQSSLEQINLPINIRWVEDGAFENTKIRNIHFSENIKHLGAGVFRNASNLEEVSLNPLLTSGDKPFENTEKLKKVNLNGNWKKINRSLFERSGIEDIHIPSSVDEIEDRAFAGTKLKRINLPYGVRKLGANIFEGTEIESLTLPESITTFDSKTIMGMNNLKSVYLPMNLQKISIDDSFKGKIDFYVYEGSKAENYLDGEWYDPRDWEIGELFGKEKGFKYRSDNDYKNYDLNKKTEIIGEENKYGDSISTLNDEDAQNRTVNIEEKLIEGIVEIGPSEFEKRNIKDSIKIPNSVRVIGERAFSNGTLTKVEIGPNLEIAKNAFQNQTTTKKLSQVVFSEGDWKKIPDGIFNETGLTKVEIPEGVEEIGSYAFAKSKLRNVKLPESLRVLYTGAFENTYLDKIELPKNVFSLWPGSLAIKTLQEITLPDSIRHVKDPFRGENVYAENLKKAKLDGNWYKIPSRLFLGTNLEEINIPNTVYHIEKSAFEGTKIKSLVIPESVGVLEENAFKDTPLEVVTISPNLNTVSFSGAENLKKVNFAGKWEKIPKGMFAYSGLSNIKLPDTITEIGEAAFAGTNINRLILPQNLRKFTDKSIWGMSKLESVYLPDNLEHFEENSIFGDDNKVYYVRENSNTHRLLDKNNKSYKFFNEIPNDDIIKERTGEVGADTVSGENDVKIDFIKINHNDYEYISSNKNNPVIVYEPIAGSIFNVKFVDDKEAGTIYIISTDSKGFMKEIKLERLEDDEDIRVAQNKPVSNKKNTYSNSKDVNSGSTILEDAKVLTVVAEKNIEHYIGNILESVKELIDPVDKSLSLFEIVDK